MLAIVWLHHDYALGRASENAYVGDRDSYDHAVGRNYDHVLAVINNPHVCNVAVFFGVVVCNSLASARLAAVVGKLAPASKARLAHREQRRAIARHRHAHDAVALVKTYGTHSARRPSELSGVVLVEPDGLALLSGHDQIVVAGRHANPCELVAAVKYDRNHTFFTYCIVRRKRSTFYYAPAGDHAEEFALLILLDTYHSRHLLIL